MLSIMDLVVPYNGAAISSDLDSRQGITIDIIILYQSPTIAKYVHSSLVAVEYSVSTGYRGKNLIRTNASGVVEKVGCVGNESPGQQCFKIVHRCLFSPYRWVTVGRDPHPSEVISIDFVLYKLPPPLLVDIDASRLAMVDLTTHYCGVGIGLHFKACYTVSMDVTVLKVTLKQKRLLRSTGLFCAL